MVQFSQIEVEDDSLREGLQSSTSFCATASQISDYIDFVSLLGIDHLIVGFPASSKNQYMNCINFLKKIEKLPQKITPWLLARSHENDIACCLEITKSFNFPVGISIFQAISPIRFKVENWSMQSVTKNLITWSQKLNQKKALFSINLEDATRSHYEDLRKIVSQLSNYSTDSIFICDTSGASDPESTFEIVSLVSNEIKNQNSNIKIGWHGHNDQGLALANSIFAAKGGAKIISGTFTGFGERAGNLPLEQFIHYLYSKGVSKYSIKQLKPLCDLFANIANIDISPRAPLIGSHCFSTAAGIHGNAIIKGLQKDPFLGDAVYSSVSATSLGRKQSFLLGPQSGKKIAHKILEDLNFDSSSESTDQLIRFAKLSNKILSENEIRNWYFKKQQFKEDT